MDKVIWTQQEASDPVEISNSLGELWAYSRRAPDKDSPNEDAAAILDLGAESLILAVADGLGGSPSGQAASELAVKALAKAAEMSEPDSALRVSIIDAFENANREILELGVGAGSTLVVAQLEAQTLRTYHVGDSTALMLGQRGKIKLETMDHSPVGYGVAAGLIDPDAARTHDERHYLSNHLGAADMHIAVGSALEMAEHDTLLLASDGVFDNLHREEIVELIRSGPLGVAADRMAEQCKQRMAGASGEPLGKPDDLTFVLFRKRRTDTATA